MNEYLKLLEERCIEGACRRQEITIEATRLAQAALWKKALIAARAVLVSYVFVRKLQVVAKKLLSTLFSQYALSGFGVLVRQSAVPGLFLVRFVLGGSV